MKIEDIMTTDVVSVVPETPFKDVVERLVQSDVSGLPVVDESGQLVGIITEADLTSKEAYGGHRRAGARAPGRRAVGARAPVGHKGGRLDRRRRHDERRRGVRPADDVRSWCPADARARREARCRSCGRRARRHGVPPGHLGDVRATRRRDRDAEITNVLATHLNRPDACHVHCTVEGGVVTLTGDVRYAWDEPVVVSLARDVQGVIEVVSLLHNREPDPRPASTGIIRCSMAETVASDLSRRLPVVDRGRRRSRRTGSSSASASSKRSVTCRSRSRAGEVFALPGAQRRRQVDDDQDAVHARPTDERGRATVAGFDVATSPRRFGATSVSSSRNRLLTINSPPTRTFASTPCCTGCPAPRSRRGSTTCWSW